MFTVTAQTDTTSVTVNSLQLDSLQISEAERLIDKYSGKISDAFTSGIESVAPMAKNGFEAVVRLQIAKGLGGLLSFALFIFSFLFGFRVIRKDRDRALKEHGHIKYWCSDGPTFKVIQGVVLALMGFIGIVIWLANDFITQSIMQLMAPEWYAIKEIINLF